MVDASKSEAIQRAYHQLERCWSSLKEDPTVADPEATMVELGDWFAEKFKAAILQEIAADPIESLDELFAEAE